MNRSEFFTALDARVAKYDLLCHPFYQAWSKGELTREDLAAYAKDYFCHVEAFPEYLAAFAMRQEEGRLRNAVLANLSDEIGEGTAPRIAHSELWLDFVEGMSGTRNCQNHSPVSGVATLIRHFDRIAAASSTEEALASFYAYESQVPRVAVEKARGLRAMYGADDKACEYFDLHATADVAHSRVWKNQLWENIASDEEKADRALSAAETAAHMLWLALDSIESRRLAPLAA